MSLYNAIRVATVPAITATAGSTADTLRISLKGARPNGNYALVVTITGTGTATINFLTKENLADSFILPADSEIITGLTASGGDGGVYSIAFTPNVTPYIGFRVTETGSANSVTAAISLDVQ